MEIELTKGMRAIVDDNDFEELSRHKWYFGSRGYAVRNTAKENGKRPIVRMCEQIIGKKDGLLIDHINGNKTDNRRINLRHATTFENQHNQTVNRAGTSSSYKGVSWKSGSKKWLSSIKINNKRYNLGVYESERDAAWVYNVWAESMFGEYARLNVLED